MRNWIQCDLSHADFQERESLSNSDLKSYSKGILLSFSLVPIFFFGVSGAQDLDPQAESQEETVAPVGKERPTYAKTDLEKNQGFGVVTTGLCNEVAFLESENLVYTASKRYEALRTAPVAVTVIPRDHRLSLDSRYIPQILRLYPGAGSAIHGANAARGVINIITRPPEVLSTFESDTSFVEHGFRQRLGGSFLEDAYSLKLTGGYDEADLWNRFEDLSINDPESAKTWRFNGTVEKQLQEGAQLRLNGGINTGKMLQHTSSGTLVDNDQTTGHVQLEIEAPSYSIRSFWNYRTLYTHDLEVPGVVTKRTQNAYEHDQDVGEVFEVHSQLDPPGRLGVFKSVSGENVPLHPSNLANVWPMFRQKKRVGFPTL